MSAENRICFFSGDITRNGGTERVAAMIANGLSQRGFSVCFLSLVEQKKIPFFDISAGCPQVCVEGGRKVGFTGAGVSAYGAEASEIFKAAGN